MTPEEFAFRQRVNAIEHLVVTAYRQRRINHRLASEIIMTIYDGKMPYELKRDPGTAVKRNSGH